MNWAILKSRINLESGRANASETKRISAFEKFDFQKYAEVIYARFLQRQFGEDKTPRYVNRFARVVRLVNGVPKAFLLNGWHQETHQSHEDSGLANPYPAELFKRVVVGRKVVYESLSCKPLA